MSVINASSSNAENAHDVPTGRGRFVYPTRIICAMPRASLRLVLLICAFSAARICRQVWHLALIRDGLIGKAMAPH
jgi:hypothetical protein